MTIHQIKALIFDMDGVLWRGDQPLVDLEKFFRSLTQKGLPYAFATNNATRHIDQYVKKLEGRGIPAVADQIFTSGKVTTNELKNRYPNGGNVFAVGSQGLTQTLADAGFSNSPQDPLAVICALDFEISYEKLRTATLLIRSGVPFIGTNGDRTFPSPEGLVPGAGSILAAIEAATDVQPEIIGKPKPTMFLQALQYLKTNPSETLVVGDRLETDIAGGQSVGCLTALMLTGVSTLQMANAWSTPLDFILNNLDELIELL